MREVIVAAGGRQSASSPFFGVIEGEGIFSYPLSLRSFLFFLLRMGDFTLVRKGDAERSPILSLRKNGNKKKKS